MKLIKYIAVMKRRKNDILLVVSIIFLYFSFGYNIFGFGYPSHDYIDSQFKSFQSDSEALVLARVDRIVEDKKANLGGFMLIDNRLPAYTPGPYTSQVGLQGMLVGIFAPNNQNGLLHYYHAARMFFAFLTALILSLFVFAISREFGLITATSLMLCISFSTWIVFFAKNLYWATFLLFAPFVLGWVFYSYFYRRGKLHYLFALIGFAVLLKALTGYEYITNVAASAIVPILYFQIKEKTNLGIIIKNSILVSLAGIAGFFLAIVIHIIQLSFYIHSISNAIGIIIDRAIVRTYPQAGLGGIYSLAGRANIFSIWKGYLLRPVFGDSKFINPVYLDSINVKLPAVSFANSGELIFSLAGVLLLLLVVIVVVILSKKLVRKPNIKMNALIFSAILSIPISFSWATLAKGHMFFHNHLNEIIFYIPLILMCYLVFSYVFQVIILYILKEIVAFYEDKVGFVTKRNQQLSEKSY